MTPPLSPNGWALLRELAAVESMAAKGRTTAARELEERGLAQMNYWHTKVAILPAGAWCVKTEGQAA